MCLMMLDSAAIQKRLVRARSRDHRSRTLRVPHRELGRAGTTSPDQSCRDYGLCAVGYCACVGTAALRGGRRARVPGMPVAYRKLVRDRIPEIIRADGRHPVTYVWTRQVTGRRCSKNSKQSIADSGAVAIMPSGRLAARIGSGSARFLSCQLVGSLSMGGCRRRAVLPGLLGTGMATGVSSAACAASQAPAYRDSMTLGVSGRDGLALEFYGGGDLIAAGLPGHRQDGEPLGLLHPGQRAVGGLDCRPGEHRP